ncbi:MAG: hypothetical protein GF383_09605 [Candidatus Lokiarchaeota archaeon]|nr:hypothetical protein [Candidatus Lokiarchaeota archaeon]MBD3340768.1 hypothetical protein [Candidatus Lokiarchaeota archaeon]
MWEWRIFLELDKVNENFLDQTLRDKLNSAFLEQRIDFYYNLKEANFGLKERGKMNHKVFLPKLELKLLIDRVGWGAELWEKCVKIQVKKSINPFIGLSREFIIENLTLASRSLHQKYSKDIHRIKRLFENSDIRRVEVKKKRRKIDIKDIPRDPIISNKITLSFEKAEISILKQSWITYEIESNNLSVLRNFLAKNQLSQRGLVMGYPKFIQMIAP